MHPESSPARQLGAFFPELIVSPHASKRARHDNDNDHGERTMSAGEALMSTIIYLTTLPACHRHRVSAVKSVHCATDPLAAGGNKRIR